MVAVPRGKALLSWRVALLPFLAENDLYKQFKLDEPWDSPHNLKLLKKMPAVYAAPGSGKADAGKTWYQVFVGEHAAFEKHRALRLADFLDGTSNTILIAEAGCPVPWTKPEDLHYARDEPLPGLGGLCPDVINVALAGGSVATLTKNGDPNTLRRAIERDDGNPIDWTAIQAPASPREAELRRQNERLHREVDRVRAQLEALRREREVLQEEDAESLHLRKENESLEKLLRQTREETERLRQEIERLKKDRNRPKDE
jgi:DNA repair exonuclease SbcCD ATPase subunit